MNSLRPFIEEGWLSRVEDGKLIESSLTIVLTGRWEPLLDEVRAMQPRHLFVDADLLQLENDPHNFDSLLAPMGEHGFSVQ